MITDTELKSSHWIVSAVAAAAPLGEIRNEIPITCSEAMEYLAKQGVSMGNLVLTPGPDTEQRFKKVRGRMVTA